MKKVTIISTSLRPGSNSNAMAEQFAFRKYFKVHTDQSPSEY